MTLHGVLWAAGWLTLGGCIGILAAGLLCSAKRADEMDARMRWERERHSQSQ